jgi:hypothetical protein
MKTHHENDVERLLKVALAREIATNLSPAPDETAVPAPPTIPTLNPAAPLPAPAETGIRRGRRKKHEQLPQPD